MLHVISDLDTSKRPTQKEFYCFDAIFGYKSRGPAVSIRGELLVANEKLRLFPLLTIYVGPVKDEK
jgi:hypothetical protein